METQMVDSDCDGEEDDDDGQKIGPFSCDGRD